MNDAREAAIRTLFPLVRRMAKRMHRLFPAAEFDDLVGDGSIGLIRAVDSFEPARGVALESYARPLIAGAMLNGMRKRDPVSERVRRTLRRAEERRFALAQERGSLPAVAELERNDPALRCARLIAERAATLSLDAPLPAGCELPSAGGADPAKPVLAASGSRELQAALARLPQRQRSILALHYLHELSLHAIGRRMSVSPQRISQLHLAALARLRRNLVRA